MVVFNLLSKNENDIQYEYYPEGKFDNAPGLIIIDVIKNEVKEIKPSLQDFVVTHTVSELNDMRESVNKIRVLEGEPELTEEEWPVAKEDLQYYQYAQHAISKINEILEKYGVFPDNGTALWY